MDLAKEQTERALVRWSKQVLAALGDIEALGPFEIRSTHKPHYFELSSGEGKLRLVARDADAETYSGERVCDFEMPAWVLREEA